MVPDAALVGLILDVRRNLRTPNSKVVTNTGLNDHGCGWVMIGVSIRYKRTHGAYH